MTKLGSSDLVASVFVHRAILADHFSVLIISQLRTATSSPEPVYAASTWKSKRTEFDREETSL